MSERFYIYLPTNCGCTVDSFMVINSNSLEMTLYYHSYNQESMVGSVIQTTGMVEFEDDLWIGKHQKA